MDIVAFLISLLLMVSTALNQGAAVMGEITVDPEFLPVPTLEWPPYVRHDLVIYPVDTGVR